MQQEALQNCDAGVYIRFRTDGSLFNLARLRAKSKVKHVLIQELLYDDDCGIFAHSEKDIQILMDNFSRACKSTRTTEQPRITVDNL